MMPSKMRSQFENLESFSDHRRLKIYLITINQLAFVRIYLNLHERILKLRHTITHRFLIILNIGH